MKAIKEITKAVQQGSTPGCAKSQSAPCATKPGIPEHWIAALFGRFQARYGHKWTAAIDGIEDQAVREWSVGLAGLEPDEIKRGLETWQDPWPPSVIEFKQACRQYATAAHRPFPKALPKPKASREVVQAELAKMRAAMRGEGVL